MRLLQGSWHDGYPAKLIIEEGHVLLNITHHTFSPKKANSLNGVALLDCKRRQEI
jgi:hypothetical protein